MKIETVAENKDRCWHDHPEDRSAAELRESAYRRGFQHGFDFLDRAIHREGITAEQLERWRRRIADWRHRTSHFAGSRHKVVEPPGHSGPVETREHPMARRSH